MNTFTYMRRPAYRTSSWSFIGQFKQLGDIFLPKDNCYLFRSETTVAPTFSLSNPFSSGLSGDVRLPQEVDAP